MLFADWIMHLVQKASKHTQHLKRQTTQYIFNTKILQNKLPSVQDHPTSIQYWPNA